MNGVLTGPIQHTGHAESLADASAKVREQWDRWLAALDDEPPDGIS